MSDGEPLKSGCEIPRPWGSLVVALSGSTRVFSSVVLLERGVRHCLSVLGFWKQNLSGSDGKLPIRPVDLTKVQASQQLFVVRRIRRRWAVSTDTGPITFAPSEWLRCLWGRGGGICIASRRVARTLALPGLGLRLQWGSSRWVWSEEMFYNMEVNAPCLLTSNLPKGRRRLSGVLCPPTHRADAFQRVSVIFRLQCLVFGHRPRPSHGQFHCGFASRNHQGCGPGHPCLLGSAHILASHHFGP